MDEDTQSDVDRHSLNSNRSSSFTIPDPYGETSMPLLDGDCRAKKYGSCWKKSKH